MVTFNQIGQKMDTYNNNKNMDVVTWDIQLSKPYL